MAEIVTVAQLRAILGVSSSLFDDAYLTDVIDTAEAVILPMLVQWRAGISEHVCTNDIETLTTIRPHNFYVGQIVDVSGVGIHSLQNKEILTIPDPYKFTVAHDIADHIPEKCIPAGVATPNSPTSYAGNPAIESAVLNTSVEVFQSRTAAGNAVDGVDFQVTPYRMGRQLVQRISSLLAPYVDTDTIAQ
jgi:hypothetical protein